MSRTTKLTKAQRARRLEAAIREALVRHKLKLTRSVYVLLRDNDRCACALGAAIASARKTRRGFEALLDREVVCHRSYGDPGKFLVSTAEGEVDELAKLVNDGVDATDLAHLEAGFEGWSHLHEDGDLSADEADPFYKAGMRLRDQAIRAGTYERFRSGEVG